MMKVTIAEIADRDMITDSASNPRARNTLGPSGPVSRIRLAVFPGRANRDPASWKRNSCVSVLNHPPWPHDGPHETDPGQGGDMSGPLPMFPNVPKAIDPDAEQIGTA